MSTNPKRTILVVDDEDNYRQSIQRLFWTLADSFPVRILEAESGDKAMKILAEEKIDCVLLDHRMPKCSGIECIERFMQNSPYLPIIMVTGQGCEQTAVEAMQKGAMDYITKGVVTPEALMRAVSNAIEKMEMKQAVKQQGEALLIAEKHRAMITSLGSVCHHLGQPMATITTCLEIIRRQELPPSLTKLVDQCFESVESVDEVLNKLQSISAYKTEPYLKDANENDAGADLRLLAI